MSTTDQGARNGQAPAPPGGPAGSAAVQITDVTKEFGRGKSATVALDRVSLSVAPGEFVCLIGASGCGKSTLLSLVAGLEAPTSGTVATGGRRVALMFQEPALFPWFTAAQNVELPLRANGVARSERRQRVTDLLQSVHLGGFADKRPHELSGGMRQRVARGHLAPAGLQRAVRHPRGAGGGAARRPGGAAEQPPWAGAGGLRYRH